MFRRKVPGNRPEFENTNLATLELPNWWEESLSVGSNSPSAPGPFFPERQGIEY